jgi:hypothetical protein
MGFYCSFVGTNGYARGIDVIASHTARPGSLPQLRDG